MGRICGCFCILSGERSAGRGRRREGRSNFYTPLVSQEKYREFDSRSVLQRLYGGSLGSFVAALTAEKPLAQSEIDELRRYLDEMSGKAGE